MKNINPVTQELSKQWSKNQIRDLSSLPPEITEGADSSISYKGANELNLHDNVEQEIYFYNLEGTNQLKGKNLCVIGTPILTNIDTCLWSALLRDGDMYTHSDKEYRHFIYEKGPFTIEKYTHTYTDDFLANIEMRMAGAQLEQALAAEIKKALNPLLKKGLRAFCL